MGAHVFLMRENRPPYLADGLELLDDGRGAGHGRALEREGGRGAVEPGERVGPDRVELLVVVRREGLGDLVGGHGLLVGVRLGAG